MNLRRWFLECYNGFLVLDYWTMTTVFLTHYNNTYEMDLFQHRYRSLKVINRVAGWALGYLDLLARQYSQTARFRFWYCHHGKDFSNFLYQSVMNVMTLSLICHPTCTLKNAAYNRRESKCVISQINCSLN